MLDKIAAETQKRVPMNDEYLVDGLLYCAKCNTAKQCRVKVLGQEKVFTCMCKCEQARRDEEKQAEERRAFEDKVRAIKRIGFHDEEMRRCTFSNDDKKNPKLTKIALKYVDNFDIMMKEREGLLLFGSVGTGKSFMAACIANALMEKGIPVLMTNFPRLCNTIQGMFEGRQTYIDGLSRFKLLVIDDLGVERKTESVSELVQTIIDSRYRSGLPMIITTNLTAEELKNPQDTHQERAYSRILEMCYPFAVDGEDRRKKKLSENYERLGKVLGL